MRADEVKAAKEAILDTLCPRCKESTWREHKSLQSEQKQSYRVCFDGKNCLDGSEFTYWMVAQRHGFFTGRFATKQEAIECCKKLRQQDPYGCMSIGLSHFYEPGFSHTSTELWGAVVYRATVDCKNFFGFLGDGKSWPPNLSEEEAKALKCCMDNALREFVRQNPRLAPNFRRVSDIEAVP